MLKFKEEKQKGFGQLPLTSKCYTIGWHHSQFHLHQSVEFDTQHVFLVG